ncbi:hypothetical protein sscle_09g069320 [Sclerotinia sclerotiorum 1980 UF-70]|uniref:Uncharacterized protein n=1 Tax=Sclerotinia sclerotiorum (strain ATCC 18683 / 1980 / Ss-1) TaxID=665079 RepID=A0A1D9QBK4_SCLS1|nr:hypothetical protein sscle_09g069320 [Sclerotinia sclerotiorum 1980 UF-70]
MNGQGIRRALTKLLEYTYVFTVVSSVGPQHSGEKEEEDMAYKYRDDALRAVMPIFQKMKAPQLRRIINVICGGT